jgi:hypothetical protein
LFYIAPTLKEKAERSCKMMAVFWVVALCSLVDVYQRFRSPCCLLIALMMEAARTSETLVNFYQTRWHYKPEDSHLHTHHRENLKSYIL